MYHLHCQLFRQRSAVTDIQSRTRSTAEERFYSLTICCRREAPSGRWSIYIVVSRRQLTVTTPVRVSTKRTRRGKATKINISLCKIVRKHKHNVCTWYTVNQKRSLIIQTALVEFNRLYTTVTTVCSDNRVTSANHDCVNSTILYK